MAIDNLPHAIGKLIEIFPSGMIRVGSFEVHPFLATPYYKHDNGEMKTADGADFLRWWLPQPYDGGEPLDVHAGLELLCMLLISTNRLTANQLMSLTPTNVGDKVMLVLELEEYRFGLQAQSRITFEFPGNSTITFKSRY